jgi:hypothetical protein
VTRLEETRNEYRMLMEKPCEDTREDWTPILEWVEGTCFEGWEVDKTSSEPCRMSEFVISGVEFWVMLPEDQLNAVCKL